MIKLSIYAKMRAGKSTGAQYLARHHKFTVLSFGDKLKRVYDDLFGQGGGKDREGYQWFGQTMRRRDPNIWIKQVQPLALRAIEKGWNVAFDDMRQPNEYEFLKSLGFVMVRIDCPDEIRLERMRKAGDKLPDNRGQLQTILNNETERYIDHFTPDFVIDNSGTPENLHRQIENLLETLKKGA